MTAAAAVVASSSPSTSLKISAATAPFAVTCATLFANAPEPVTPRSTWLPRAISAMRPLTASGTCSGVSASPQ
jgi:hypothetical protein